MFKFIKRLFRKTFIEPRPIHYEFYTKDDFGCMKIWDKPMDIREFRERFHKDTLYLSVRKDKSDKAKVYGKKPEGWQGIASERLTEIYEKTLENRKVNELERIDQLDEVPRGTHVRLT